MATLALLFTTTAVVAAEGDPTRPPSPPPCEVGGRVPAGDPSVDHGTWLLDLSWRLPPGFEPTDLVSVRQAGFDADLWLREVVIEDLRAMREAAAAEGLGLAVQSAYRSETYQHQVHQGWVAQLGAERAALVSARPGHSEHQLGTAIDLRSAGGPPAWDLDDWGATPEGAWVAAHAHRFGFVISYPKDSREQTCYDHEPWHLRWVGRSMAAAVQESGWPLRVYLHAHHPPVELSAP